MPQGINFQHDCDRCIPLGTGHQEGEKGSYDLYFCPDNRHGFHTVLARYGNDGPDYRSFAVDSNVKKLFEINPKHVLAVTYQKAVAMGYFK